MGIIIMFKFVATLAATAVSVEEEMPINEAMIQEAIAADELKFGADEMAELDDDENLLEVGEGEMTDAEFWGWAKKAAARARAAAARAAALARYGRALYSIGRRLYSGNTRQRKAAARQLIRLIKSNSYARSAIRKYRLQGYVIMAYRLLR